MLPDQSIDLGCEHLGKIVVYDKVCKTIAKKIVKFLNQL
jgi:hypothetical protein